MHSVLVTRENVLLNAAAAQVVGLVEFQLSSAACGGRCAWRTYFKTLSAHEPHESMGVAELL